MFSLERLLRASLLWEAGGMAESSTGLVLRAVSCGGRLAVAPASDWGMSWSAFVGVVFVASIVGDLERDASFGCDGV